jgi:ABC-type multidrug transport system ATPase subunit
VSGEFRSNELTAIIGPSGSGKSSLLNVLSAYKTKGVNGSIQLNGVECQDFVQQYSAYIMQEYKFHKFITVYETLMFSINCKNSECDESVKREKVRWGRFTNDVLLLVVVVGRHE